MECKDNNNSGPSSRVHYMPDTVLNSSLMPRTNDNILLCPQFRKWGKLKYKEVK